MATPCCCCGHLSDSPKQPVPLNERIQRAIHVLQLDRLSLFAALLKVLDPAQKDFATHRDRIYACTKDQPHGKLALLLDCLYEDPRGKAQLLAWMEPHAFRTVARKVYTEMDDIKRALHGTIDTVSPEFLLTWDINTIVQKVVEDRAPVLAEILESASQSDRASRKKKRKDIRTVGATLIGRSNLLGNVSQRHDMLSLPSLQKPGRTKPSISPLRSHFFSGKMVHHDRLSRRSRSVGSVYHSHRSSTF
jgi:hypothetical protein